MVNKALPAKNKLTVSKPAESLTFPKMLLVNAKEKAIKVAKDRKRAKHEGNKDT